MCRSRRRRCSSSPCVWATGAWGWPWRRSRRCGTNRRKPSEAHVEQRLAPAPASPAARGLSSAQAAERLRRDGPNRVARRGAGWTAVLVHQFQNPLLVLLAGVAVLSIALGQHTDATIVLTIAAMSTGLGFVNEYRSQRVLEDLRARMRRRAVVERDGRVVEVDSEELVGGDVIRVEAGDVVPADGVLLESHALECDESVLTGESEPVEKSARAADRIVMGSVVRAGAGVAVVTATGMRTAYGALAGAAARALPESAFARGLRGFSGLLLAITAWITGVVFLASATLLARPLWESLLFALAIAVSLAPQLLPAIVTVSMAVGARRLAEKGVVVKRLAAIEDLGDMQVLFTDKTGTLTEGRVGFDGAVDVHGAPALRVLLDGLLCNEAAWTEQGAVGGNTLDRALWSAAAPLAAQLREYRRVEIEPFDYDRRLTSVLVDGPAGRMLVAKGAPESILARCAGVDAATRAYIERLFDAGVRTLAVAECAAAAAATAELGARQDLTLIGLLLFSDPLKRDAGASIERLRHLGVDVKVLSGDNERVTRKLCTDLGVCGEIVTGAQLEALNDTEAAAAIARATIFAR
ncbi:HAD family hydrolase, partial [bacterium]